MTDSRPIGAATRRRRKCTACGYRFSSLERIEETQRGINTLKKCASIRLDSLAPADRQLVEDLVKRLGGEVDDDGEADPLARPFARADEVAA